MKVERKQWGDVSILSFVGEFDAFNLPTFSSKIDNLIENGQEHLVFNLRLLTFINSSALGYLVKTKKKLEEGGGDLVLVSPSKFVKKALTVLGLHQLFKIFETEEEGVLFFHRGGDVASLDLSGLDTQPDDKLLGENAIMFRLLEESGEGILGPTPFIGKISNLYQNGLVFRWKVPSSGGRSRLTTDNFDELFHPGRALSVKFRQPFVAKTKYFEAKAAVMKVNKEIQDDGVPEATIHIEYTDIDTKDKEALDSFVTDLEGLRREVR